MGNLSGLTQKTGYSSSKKPLRFMLTIGREILKQVRNNQVFGSPSTKVLVVNAKIKPFIRPENEKTSNDIIAGNSNYLIQSNFFIRKLFQSTRLCIEGILNGRYVFYPVTQFSCTLGLI